ncbi:cation transporting protein [Niveomyces insectorum RCEF 264]|uniref:Cation transporting protein n=1 Tax=Niveomyces insectorum RCEF 264 TaxID=1081102 RepID=A0A167Z4Y2_9HYPO|nr:cation transporting protein [Niveomyces insectorum RCEF 264]
MAPSLVDNAQIKSAELLVPLPVYYHTYVWPFAVMWPVFLYYYLSPELYEKHIGAPEWTFVWVGSILTVQSLAWLSTNWSVNVKAIFTASKTKSVAEAKLIKVIPVANAGAPEICKIDRDNVGGKTNTSFLFQKRRFLYNPETQSFATLAYAIDADPKPTLAQFQKSRGITSAAEIDRIEQHYGTNTFDIPVPTFTELFREHAVAPFFVFQVFCVGLWMLDEYWYYSLFTLVMLVAFESTVVWQRQRTLNEFRSMSIKPFDLWAYRAGRWTEVPSDRLLPGDLVSVSRTKEDSGVACDMLLIEGTAIVNEAMLSGESTPLLKDSVLLRPGDAKIDPEGLDKNAFLWGGTKVLQVTHGSPDDAPPKSASGVPPPPDGGAMAVVIKTGFETSQGSLVRTMIYSTERVSANNAEALWFILFLLVFALAASWYVWDEGVKKDRKRSKLLLDCILIITSVVPPELPMELSLAVNTSLAALAKFAIFCTEPFRIPFAGRIDVACFDKTGTLTGEDLVVEGIAGLGLSKELHHAAGGTDTPREADGAHSHMTPVGDAGLETTLVLATAHALVKLDEGEVVGDPMEKATLSALGWTLGRKDILTSKPVSAAPIGGVTGTVQIKRRFQFSSALKRQSAVATVHGKDPKTGGRIQGTFVAVKGAPETIMRMLVTVPDDYEETFKYFTRMGSRVLALAYKQLTTDNELGASRINDLKRENVEADLHFAGFLVLHCPLKDDAKEAVQMLNESSHRVVMITGDNPLTAVHVAREVEIVDRDVLILDVPDHSEGGKELVWHSVDDKVHIKVDATKRLDPQILRTKDLCVTGHALAQFQNQVGWRDILRHAWVYARVSPKQKEEILLGLKDMGYYTLMAGDGTNDVGALKQAHIGVALLNGTQDDLTRIAEHARNTKMKEMYQKQVNLMQRWNQPAPPVPVVMAHLFPPGPTNPHFQKAVEREAKRKNITPEEYVRAHVPGGGVETITSPGAAALQTQQQANNHQDPRQAKMQQKAASLADQFTASMMETELDDNEPPTLKLGDASVAAPFTSKLRNVIAVPNIIRQGRCTLVATIQMYKILALNCLISAYSLSVLYLEGIKFGDGQYTISGMLMSVCFLSISRARSVEGLSKERPQPNIFNFYIIGSILGQFVVHVVTLIYIARLCDRLDPRSGDIDLEADFAPSLLNSAVYLLQLIQQISTFAVNYQGRPFRESLSENRGMFYGIVGVTGVAFACSTEFIPELNVAMKLVPFSSEFKWTMTTVMIVDYAACYLIEIVLKWLFSDLKARDIAERRPDQLERERVRKETALRAKMEEEAAKEREKVAEFERKQAERLQRVEARLRQAQA